MTPYTALLVRTQNANKSCQEYEFENSQFHRWCIRDLCTSGYQNWGDSLHIYLSKPRKIAAHSAKSHRSKNQSAANCLPLAVNTAPDAYLGHFDQVTANQRAAFN